MLGKGLEVRNRLMIRGKVRVRNGFRTGITIRD